MHAIDRPAPAAPPSPGMWHRPSERREAERARRDAPPISMADFWARVDADA